MVYSSNSNNLWFSPCSYLFFSAFGPLTQVVSVNNTNVTVKIACVRKYANDSKQFQTVLIDQYQISSI